MDSLTLRGIEVWTKIGVPDAERAKPQRLLVDLELKANLKEVAEHDDVSKGIDYAAVVAVIRGLGETERKTVERFAEDAAEVVLKQFKPREVTVVVRKHPDLPIEEAIVTITRP